MKWPQGTFLRPCGPIGWDTSRQEGSRESGPKAIKKALVANPKSGPKGLFYGLVARLMIGWDGPLFALAPRDFSTALWPDSLERRRAIFFSRFDIKLFKNLSKFAFFGRF
jgi:hypothetical protein